jgi:5'-3' exonuclease
MAKQFLSFVPNNKNLLLVDGLNLAFRWKHIGATEFSEEYARTVNSLAKSYKCGTIIIASDYGASSFRKALFPDYKGNREELRAQQTEEEQQAFYDFLEGYNRAIEEINYPIFKYKNVEADDIIAFIVKNRELFGFDNIWIVSSDKDLDLLINEHVSRFSYVTRKETTESTWHEHYDIDPDEYVTYKCLLGDSGDNIPGVAGVGPKRAVQLINEYGNIFDIIDVLPINSKYKHIQNLNKFEEQLLLNIQLVDLISYCEDALGEENCKDIIERLTNEGNDFDS